MPLQSDTGNAPNLDNFLKLKHNCSTFNPPYDPGRAELKLSALNTLYNDCDNAQKALNSKSDVYHRLVADRSATYKTLSPITTQCLAIFKSCGALPQTVSRAITLANKIRGIDTRKDEPGEEPTPETPPETENPNDSNNETNMTEEDKRYSVSQMSFVMRAENFSKFVIMLSQEPKYLPSNNDLKVTALETFLATLIQYNESIHIYYQDYKAALENRNRLFTGMIDIALDVKEVVKGDYGTKSNAYQSIKSLKFIRMYN